MGRKNTINNSKESAGLTGPFNQVTELLETQGNEAQENDIRTDAREWLIEKLTPYFDVYPNEKVFYITSDGQVFLEKSHNDAINHQRRFDKTKDLLSFVRE